VVSFDPYSNHLAAAFCAIHVAPPGVCDSAHNTLVKQNCKQVVYQIRDGTGNASFRTSQVKRKENPSTNGARVAYGKGDDFSARRLPGASGFPFRSA
jgi:hypothetical protein